MTITVDIMPEVETELARQAAHRGEPVETYVAGLLGHRTAALDWSQCAAVASVREKVGGAWVFRDTRMPVSVVFENMEDGMTVDELIGFVRRSYAGTGGCRPRLCGPEPQ